MQTCQYLWRSFFLETSFCQEVVKGFSSLSLFCFLLWPELSHVSDTGAPDDSMETAAKRCCESFHPFDIGHLVGKVENASSDDVKSFLDNVWKPLSRMDCPSTSGRRFQLSWMETYPWLAYSKEVVGAFCIQCVVFGHRFQVLSKNSSKLEQL